MLKIGSHFVHVSAKEVLSLLQKELRSLGIDKLRSMKESGNSIMISCPVHKDGKESNPSCGVSTYLCDVPEGFAHCFACGYTGTIEDLVSRCFGYDDNGYYGKKWLVSKFLTGETITHKRIQDIKIGNKKYVQNIQIDESVLSTFAMNTLHPYLVGRGIDEHIAQIFQLGFDMNFLLNGKIFECITAPVRNEIGELQFVARRSINGKMYHYPDNIKKPVYGLYEVMKYCPETQFIVITEGMFDMFNCWKFGYPSVCLLGTGTPYQYKILERSKIKKFITGFDPDNAGDKATKKFIDYFYGKKFIDTILLENKDIGDMNLEEFTNCKIISQTALQK